MNTVAASQPANRQRSCRRLSQTQAARVKALRRSSTYPERKLWQILRRKQLAGYKFRRQHPIGNVVVDFCCPQAKLVVEVDGLSHMGQAEHDANRTAYLSARGYRVVRVTNDDVLADESAVIELILQALRA